MKRFQIIIFSILFSGSLNAQMSAWSVEFNPVNIQLLCGEQKLSDYSTHERAGKNQSINTFSTGFSLNYSLSTRLDLKIGLGMTWLGYKVSSGLEIQDLKAIIQSDLTVPNTQRDYRLSEIRFKNNYVKIPVGINIHFRKKDSRKGFQPFISIESGLSIRTNNEVNHNYYKPLRSSSGVQTIINSLFAFQEERDKSVLTAELNKHLEELPHRWVIYSKLGISLMKFKRGVMEESTFKSGFELAWVRFFTSLNDELITNPGGIQVTFKFLLPVYK